jgi:hypothetical protein
VTGGTIAITDVRTGPAGLVVVTMGLPDGAVRRLVLPRRLAGVAQVEWSAKALAALTELQGAPA